MSNYFEILNAVDVRDKTEKKNGLSYLSWAWAWGEIKKRHPDAVYTIYENDLGWFYHTDGKTCWVKTGVTIEGIEHIEYLPVMDYKNKSIPAESVTSFDVNKAIQRSLTKAVARHGLGLYIYAGEDLPEGANNPLEEETAPADMYKPMTYEKALEMIVDIGKHSGKTLKDVYKEDKGHIKELFELGGPDIKQAINIINREIKKKNESKSDSKDQ